MDYTACVSNFFIVYFGSIIRIIVLSIVGIPLMLFMSRWLSSFCTKKFSQYSGILLNRIVLYSGIGFILITILYELGFNVSALLGAAGVFGFAVGFASQTSISNIISGFFLVIEHPFMIGDIIKSGEVTGSVESVDLLAVRIRTSDNRLIRLPNEMVLKNSLTNTTFYDKRRFDCIVSIVYTQDIETIQNQLLNALASEELFLKNPKPTVQMYKIGTLSYDSTIRIFLMVRVWVEKKYSTIAPSQLIETIKNECDQHNIVITIETN